jgi:hypothetical protein
VREREKKKLVRELVSEYYSSELVSNFIHQNFFVKVVRFLEVIFWCFHQISSPKNYFGEATRNILMGKKQQI